MGAIAFDTHAFVKKLENCGFKEEQAEALSEAIKEVQEAHLEELATKGDILELKRDIKELRLEFNGQLNLLKWMIGFIFAGVLSIVLKSFFM
jgi:hypothetical protein